MNAKSRITSIIKANSLDFSVTGLGVFNLSELNIESDLEFHLPTNIRLGHLVEKIVSELIKSSSNYKVLHENIQVIENKKTIGEIDFILEKIDVKQVFHMELAYKFYLFDPSISLEPINNWIGPNRNDSLIDKLKKLRSKQFPLLYHNCSKSIFENIEIENVTQSLCLLVSLFIPYKYKGSLHSSYEKAVKGYYINLETFISLDNSDKSYHVPFKKEWGIDPSDNEEWAGFYEVEKNISISITENQAPLVWQKHKENYTAFFVVWW